jgi:hypothetical protein
MDRLHGLVRFIGEQEFADSTLTLRYASCRALSECFGSLAGGHAKPRLSGSIAHALMGFTPSGARN